MGAKTSSMFQDVTNRIDAKDIKKTYFTQIYLNNKKTKTEFTRHLKSIIKRI